MSTSTEDEVEALRKRLQRDAAVKEARERERRARLRAQLAFSPSPLKTADQLIDVAQRVVRKELLGAHLPAAERVPTPILIHLSDELLALAAENVGEPGSAEAHEVGQWLLARARERLQGA